MLSIFRPESHRERLPEERIDPVYRRLRWQIFLGIFFGYAAYYLVRKNFSLSPAAIIKALDLRRPIYKQTAAYGHMGRTDIDLPWERTDKAASLKEQAGL